MCDFSYVLQRHTNSASDVGVAEKVILLKMFVRTSKCVRLSTPNVHHTWYGIIWPNFSTGMPQIPMCTGAYLANFSDSDTVPRPLLLARALALQSPTDSCNSYNHRHTLASHFPSPSCLPARKCSLHPRPSSCTLIRLPAPSPACPCPRSRFSFSSSWNKNHHL